VTLEIGSGPARSNQSFMGFPLVPKTKILLSASIWTKAGHKLIAHDRFSDMTLLLEKDELVLRRHWG